MQAVGEVGVLGVGAQVGERQHCDAGTLAERWADELLPGLLGAHRETGPERKRDQNDGMRHNGAAGMG